MGVTFIFLFKGITRITTGDKKTIKIYKDHLLIIKPYQKSNNLKIINFTNIRFKLGKPLIIKIIIKIK